MKKFEDKFNENISLIKTALGDVCSVTHVKAVFKDWISPEDHQAEIGEFKRENQRLRNLLEAAGESSKELLDINKKLRGDLGDAQGKLRGSEDHIKELKSQLEKQQPEIPEFMANYIEAAKEDFWTLLSAMDDSNLSSRVGDWLKGGNFRNQEIFAQAWLNGYTVAKEKRFYLKNKLTTSYLELDKTNDYFQHTMNPAPYTDMTRKSQFTQQEIDSMETGSYEQIEVEE